MKRQNLEDYKIISVVKGNITAQWKDNTNDLFLCWDLSQRVRFNELKNAPAEKVAVIRIMPKYEGCDIQFRATQPLDEYGKGVARNLIATASLSLEDLENIIAHIKSKK